MDKNRVLELFPFPIFQVSSLLILLVVDLGNIHARHLGGGKSSPWHPLQDPFFICWLVYILKSHLGHRSWDSPALLSISTQKIKTLFLFNQKGDGNFSLL